MIDFVGWWDSTKRRARHFWHEHFSTVSNEQLEFERRAAVWRRVNARWDHMRELERQENRTFGDEMSLMMYYMERDYARELRAQIYGSNSLFRPTGITLDGGTS